MMKKFLCLLVIVLTFTTIAIPANAATESYHVYADKWYIMSNGIGVGGEGWTRLVGKTSGDDLRHYTNVRVYFGSLNYDSGRIYGTGKVYASTGNLKKGAVSSISIYYGTT